MNEQVANAIVTSRRAAVEARELEQALSVAVMCGDFSTANHLSVRVSHQWSFAREMLRTAAELILSKNG